MRIHQLLHGYSEGHKLLATSISNIPPKDRKKLAVLSDWDEYATGSDDDSYITCYPLSESNYYAIAKTWYANEMNRPGCVWTHTLLIDCSEETEFLDLRQLYHSFIRPEVGDFSLYEKPIEIASDEMAVKNSQTLQFNEPSLDYWFHKLLFGNEPLIFSVEKSSSYYQMLVLGIISHLPRSLMFRYSLCSGTGRVRKYENEVFDLQFITSYKNSIQRLSRSVEGAEVEGWCNFVATSIRTGGDNVPRLVSRFSSDISDNVDKYAAVILIYELIDRLKEPGEQNVSKFSLVLRVMAEAFPDEEDGKSFKCVILSPGLTKYFFDEKDFIYQMAVTKYWETFDYEKMDFALRARAYFKSHQTSDYASMLERLLECKEDNPYKQTVLDNVDIEFNLLQVENLIEEHWKLFRYLAQRNDKALNNDLWLKVGKEKFTELVGFFFKKIPEEYLYWRPLLEKMLEYNYAADSFQIETMSSHVPDISAEILFELNEGHYLNSGWVGYCKRNPHTIIDWLGGQGSVNKQIVSLVLDVIDPESEMVRRSENTKWRVLQSAPVELGSKLEFAVFLFLLSYNLKKDELAFSLYRKAFQTIYEATEKSQIGYYWSKISAYCPRPFLGLEWDKCDLLRKGFANRVYDEGRNIGTARNFTTEKRINKKLLKAVVRKFEAEG